jgi:hypothetical protein
MEENQFNFGLSEFEAALNVPNHIVESAWLEHGPFAIWLAKQMAPGVFVELGSHNGFSYFAFCESLKSLSGMHQAFAIDTWQGDSHAGFYGDDVYSQVQEVNAHYYSGFSTLIRSTFDEALVHFDDMKVDLLHIDGLHTYEAVKHDFESWKSKLSDHAVVLFHDTNVRQTDFGVHKLWSELRNEYPNFTFSHGHGLGVLKVGTKQTNVDWLFELDDVNSAYVSKLFAGLGARVRIQRERNVYLHMNFTKNQDLAEESSKNQSLTSELANLREEYIRIALEATLAQERLERVLDSLTWRLTSPIRRVIRLSKRG